MKKGKYEAKFGKKPEIEKKWVKKEKYEAWKWIQLFQVGWISDVWDEYE